MEPSFLSPYLQAIQNVAGSTPGEKYKTLNHIARKIVSLSHGQNNTIQVQSSSELPEALVPVVKVEIAKILRQFDEIVEALKSDDNLIFQRALQTKWFFDGSIENVTNINYFNDRIFNYISVKNRYKLIKKLSIHLTANKKDNIAEEFYETLSNMYGIKVSEPLLLACSESFIWGAIITRQLVLSVKIVKQLYDKYPSLIIKYLQINKPSDEQHKRNLHVIPNHKYSQILLRLLKKDIHTYIEFIEAYPEMGEKLSRRCTDIFLKQATETLIQKPSIFAPIMNLKSITSKLTKEKFKLFFRNLFSENSTKEYSTFSFMKMYKYLEYYPSDEKVSLLLSTFKEVYNESFLDQDYLIGPEVLTLLSPEDRYKVAKRKFERDANWYIKDFWKSLESSWRCYLPISESIPIIKNEISKTSVADLRRELLKLMIYSCKVNNDDDALLKVLEYIETRHKNERGDILLGVIERLLNDIQTQNLSIQHWKILDNITQLLYIKDQLLSNPYTVKKLFVAKVHFSLVNNLSITETIKFLFKFDMNMLYSRDIWNILKEYPDYERKCLEEFINIAPSLFPTDESKIDLTNSFLNAINNFNKRISCTKNKIEPMTVENYSWLLAEILQLVNNDDDKVVGLRENLKEHNRNLYHAWVKEKFKIINLHSNIEFNEWITNPHKIIIHWEKYLSQCQDVIHYRKYAQRCIKKCRWYQNVPIKFAEKCLKDVTDNQDSNALKVLALLYEGLAFERIINPFLPTSPSIDIESEEAKENYLMMQSIPEALFIVNPPVSLDITLKFCNKDTIHMVGNWLKVLARQTPVDKLIPFSIKLMNQPVSVSKHFIRLFPTVVKRNQIHSVFINLWRSEKHHTIRTLVFDNIFNLFVTNPSNQTWLSLNECIDGLTADDKRPLSSICCLGKIPNEYIVDYVRKLFTILRELIRINNKIDPGFIWSHIEGLLQLDSDIAALLPEEFHQEILKTYFTNMSLPSNVLFAAQYYLINAYINPSMEKLKSRLNFYSKFFIDILKTQWDIPDSLKPNIYPRNYMVDTMMNKMLSYIADKNIREQFIDVTLNAFRSVLTPLQAPAFYSYYIFASLYRGNKMSIDEYVNQIGKNISSLIDTFSVEFIPQLGKILSQCLELLWNDYNLREEVTFDVIEGLLKLNIEHATILATAIPVWEGIKENERYTNILQTLRKQKNPAVVAYASMEINILGYKNV